MATHLEMFMSDDGKLGRVWKDTFGQYMRRANGDWLGRGAAHEEWQALREQVATRTEEVTWADEPKTLTPQEALRALADGKCLKICAIWSYRDGGFRIWGRTEKRWLPSSIETLDNPHCRVVPDPSQPAEPRSEWNPLGKYEDIPQDMQEDIKTERGWAKHEPAKSPLKVGDRVRRAPGCECHLEEGDSPCRIHGENEEAEPQEEFPLTFAEAYVAALKGGTVFSEISPSLHVRAKSIRPIIFECVDVTKTGDEWEETAIANDEEAVARWRIVEEGER